MHKNLRRLLNQSLAIGLVLGCHYFGETYSNIIYFIAWIVNLCLAAVIGHYLCSDDLQAIMKELDADTMIYRHIPIPIMIWTIAYASLEWFALAFIFLILFYISMPIICCMNMKKEAELNESKT